MSSTTKQVSFKVSRADAKLLSQITRRVSELGVSLDDGGLIMDLTACHANGCPLDQDKLLTADDFNLMHDVAGIQRHIDRKTGELMNCFLPRCSA